MKKIFIGLLMGLIALNANAQFNRVGNQASLQLSYIDLNPEFSNSWQGVQITNVIPLGIQEKVFDQPLRFNLDLNAGYTQNSSLKTATFGSYGFGLTTWINQNFDKAEWSIAPYFRAGIAANSGTLNANDNQYWSYQVEPGLVGKYGNFYGLIAYNYSDGFKKDGYLQSALAIGAGVDLTKSFAIETRYDIGYGNYNVNKLNIGVTYKF